jgi:hypothetical protein
MCLALTRAKRHIYNNYFQNVFSEQGPDSFVPVFADKMPLRTNWGNGPQRKI